MASNSSLDASTPPAGNREPVTQETQEAAVSAPAKRSPKEQSCQRSPSFLPASVSGENRLRPAADVINRILWDSKFEHGDFVIGYEDRFEGRLEASLGSWKRDLTDEEFIPQHRILYIKRKDGEIVWDRRRRTDKIFHSGNSAFPELAFLY